MTLRNRLVGACAVALVTVGLPLPSASAVSSPLAPAGEPTPPVTSLIVRYEPGEPRLLPNGDVNGQEQVTGADLVSVRSGANGTTVVGLAAPVSQDEAAGIAAQLEQDPGVAWAEPNAWLRPTAFPATPPNDPSYGSLGGLWGD